MGEQKIAPTLLLILCLVLPTLPLVRAAEDSWTVLEPMPTARSGFGVAVVDGKIYAIGGWNGGFLSTNEMYDSETDTWTTKQPMPTARCYFAIAVYMNKIYVIVGAFGEKDIVYVGSLGVNEVYDPLTDTWETLEPMPTSRAHLDANIGEDKIYVIDDGFSETPMPTQIYDPETDLWTTGSPMPTPRWFFDVAVVNDELYAIGGYNGDTCLTVNEKYTPAGYIPEFPAWIIFPMLLSATEVVLIYKNKLRKVAS